MRVLVIGARGLLGAAIVREFEATAELTALDRQALDVSNASAVVEAVAAAAPDVIVNCAAYNDVDGAERDAETALRVNALAVQTLAASAREAGATLVHYSSDFVFDGETDRPYVEEDPPNPRGAYAASKLAGEWFATGAASHYVLRVESLFGGAERRKSSMDRIIDAVLAGGPARVFVDRVVSPSYVWDVVTATAAILRTRPAVGIYHCVNTGAATWHDVAVETRRQLQSDSVLEPITMGDVMLRAPRPRFCALSNDKLRAAGITMPTWQDAVARAIAERHSHATPH